MPAARLTVWGEAECHRLHQATLELLNEVGVEVTYEPPLEMFAAAGADVQDRRVRLPAEVVQTALDNAPSEFLLKPRGGETEPLVMRD
ncbi:MAG: trimethylamine methyltransferase family protein, partial [Actinobacteria bacterium]|nr:trimethylamine methyltransferase family protein [Actinomycetota bacterium]